MIVEWDRAVRCQCGRTGDLYAGPVVHRSWFRRSFRNDQADGYKSPHISSPASTDCAHRHYFALLMSVLCDLEPAVRSRQSDAQHNLEASMSGKIYRVQTRHKDLRETGPSRAAISVVSLESHPESADPLALLRGYWLIN